MHIPQMVSYQTQLCDEQIAAGNIPYDVVSLYQCLVAIAAMRHCRAHELFPLGAFCRSCRFQVLCDRLCYTLAAMNCEMTLVSRIFWDTSSLMQ